jgi:hypothetical protein
VAKSKIDHKQFAFDLAWGRIFTDRHIARDYVNRLGEYIWPTMPSLLSVKDFKKIIYRHNGDYGLLYSYFGELDYLHLGIMPVFKRVRLLPKWDFDKVRVQLKWIDENMSGLSQIYGPPQSPELTEDECSRIYWALRGGVTQLK